MHRPLWVWSFKAAVTVTAQSVVRGAECTNVFLLLLWMYSVWTEPIRSAFRCSGERSIVVKVTLKCSRLHIRVRSAGFKSFLSLNILRTHMYLKPTFDLEHIAPLSLEEAGLSINTRWEALGSRCFSTQKGSSESANVIFFNMSFHQLLPELTKKKLVNTKAWDQRVDVLDYTWQETHRPAGETPADQHCQTLNTEYEAEHMNLYMLSMKIKYL